MFDNESVRAIELLNYFSNMEHRTGPYDLNKIEDLKHALKMAVAAYCDYDHYDQTLNNLVEWFDESLEHYDTVTWINMTREPSNTDGLAMKCAASLSKASNNFAKLRRRAKENLSVILKVVMTAPDAVQQDVLGKVYDISADDIDNRLNDLYFYHLETAEYQYAIDDSLDVFLKSMREWSELEPEPEQERDFEPLPF